METSIDADTNGTAALDEARTTAIIDAIGLVFNLIYLLEYMI